MFTTDVLNFALSCSYADIKQMPWDAQSIDKLTLCESDFGLILHLVERDIHSDPRLSVMINISECVDGEFEREVTFEIHGCWVEPDGDDGEWSNDLDSYHRELRKLTAAERERIQLIQRIRLDEYLSFCAKN